MLPAFFRLTVSPTTSTTDSLFFTSAATPTAKRRLLDLNMAVGLSSLDKPGCRQYRPSGTPLSTPLSILQRGISVVDRRLTGGVASLDASPKHGRSPVDGPGGRLGLPGRRTVVLGGTVSFGLGVGVDRCIPDEPARFGRRRCLFDARYLSSVADDAVLYVGTKDGAAIGYLCDPGAGSRWFTGTATGGQIDLHDAKGGRVTGAATANAFEATVSGISGYDGTFTIPAAAPGARLIREGGVPAGQLVGGLVFDGEVIRGVVTVGVIGTIPGSASLKPGQKFAIGVKVTAGQVVDLTVSTDPRLSSGQQSAIDSAMKEAEEKAAAAMDSATTALIAGIVCGLVTMAAATVSMSGAGTMATAALKSGKLGDLDPTAGGFLTSALKGIVEGIKVTTSTPRPSSSGTPKRSTLGTITYGSFSGGL